MRIGTGVSYSVMSAVLAMAGLTAAGLTAAGVSAAPAAAQPANPCLALPTDAERLVCMRDSRTADEASRASAEAAFAAAEAQTESRAQTPANTPANTQAPSPAQIQTAASGQSAADRCFALPTDAERLSCMRDALAIAEAALAAEQADGDGGLLGLGIFGGGGGRPDALVASESEFAAGFGAEQIRGNRPPLEEIRLQAAVVSISEREPGVHEFELDNGQVWRQLRSDTQDVRLSSRQEHPVELSSHWAGGYRMRILSQSKTLAVERIR